jgi:hypothetical protein
MKPMRENHRHETAAAIAPGAVLLGFAGSTQPAGMKTIAGRACCATISGTKHTENVVQKARPAIYFAAMRLS